MQTLKTRHQELVELRNDNSKTSKRLWGDGEIVSNPVYDVKHLDKMINNVAKELRNLDEAIKYTNTQTQVQDYTKNEIVLGELA